MELNDYYNETTSEIPEALTTVAEDIEQWTMFDPALHTRRLNRILLRADVRAVYDKASRAADAVHRWDLFQWYNYERLPGLTEPLEGEELLFPDQLECSDWMWCLPPGRRPNYYRFVCSRYCHWLSEGHRLVASLLFPDLQWDVICSDKHTTAVCVEEKLLFDLTFAAMGVTAKEALQMVMGEDLTGTDFDYFREDTYDCTLSAGTGQALEFWKLCDNHPGDRQDLALELKQVIESGVPIDVSETAVDIAWNCGELLEEERELQVA